MLNLLSLFDTLPNHRDSLSKMIVILVKGVASTIQMGIHKSPVVKVVSAVNRLYFNFTLSTTWMIHGCLKRLFIDFFDKKNHILPHKMLET